MKTIVCEKPNQFAYKNVEVPLFQSGNALVRIKRIGICGTDLHAYKGNQPFFTYPRVLGHELSGEVEQIGNNNFGLKKGDSVSVIPYLECGECIACKRGKSNCCTNMQVMGVHVDGGMAEILSVPMKNLIKTNEISFDQAAILEPLSIGAHAVRRSEIKENEYALVIGAGPIGLGVMALAKKRGAKVIALDINEERLDFCRKWAKVDHTVNVKGNVINSLMEITSGDMPTVVFDATGNVMSMSNSFDYVSHGGKLIFVGLVKDDITFSDPEFHKKELTLLASRNATKEDFQVVIDAVKNGYVDASTFITHRTTFDQMIEVYESWYNPEEKVIKAIVEL
ncbi:alcohol dehydrogenase catalytic domain-containing protein [Aquibacillus halophilus]|uniref:Alcohol dehydrogenase catalytic domain-containing protein n=1 Tax=Aquibacillus halophilus TaxID=930132 RepID=A0A6A8DIB8_9BACI|nr:zinc-binding alcohol dehydrogenase family protein [Aquibacillus halophilus]MRH41062.1 alcohol dehydrogenase catalytic domain-containing protein [Aquibacillus halophilus]